MHDPRSIVFLVARHPGATVHLALRSATHGGRR